MAFDFIDFYVIYPAHPIYDPKQIDEDDVIRVIIQKYYTILFTNKGELLGDPDFGADLELLLYETGLDEDSVRGVILDELQKYMPEIFNTDFSLEVYFVEMIETYQEMMFISLVLKDYELVTQIGRVS